MIKAFKFGLLEPIAGYDQSVQDQLFLRNKLWNAFVSLEHEHREKYRALLLESDMGLNELQKQSDEYEEKIQSLVDQKRKLRASVRSKNVDTSMLDSQIAEIKAARKDLTVKLRDLRVAVKEKIKPAIKELDAVRYEKVKDLIASSGLWWGNSETVYSAYETARGKAMKEGGELKFHSFDGTGKFAVRQSGGFPLEELFSGKFTMASIKALPVENFNHLSERGRRSRARHELTMTIYTYVDEDTGKKVKHTVTWPIVLHREMPEGLVKQLHVHRKRIGNRFEWSCSFTLDINEEPKQLIDHPATKACGIDIGFRLVKDGLRVATMVSSDGAVKHLVLPQDWLDRLDHVESLQSELSEQANLTWERLKKCLASMPEFPESLKDRITSMLRAGDKLPLKSMKVLRSVLMKAPELMPAAYEILKAWDKDTYRQEREMHNLRNKLMERRKHIYRNFAFNVAKEYSLIRIEDMGLKEMAIVKTDDGSDNDMPKAVRDNRKRASLHELVLCIKQSSDKTGVAFEKMKAQYSTMTCSSCGQLNAKTDDLFITCSFCHTTHDVDENAAKNFLNGEDFYIKEQSVA